MYLALRAVAVSAVLSTTAMAQTFDRLTACDDMSALRQAVDRAPPSCKSPIGPIARAIAARTQSPTCFFKPALKSLQGFECAQYQQVPVLTCFAPTPSGAVRTVKAQFASKYSEIVSGYLANASRCSYSSGRASPAPQYMISTSPLGWVAKADLAYGVETGSAGRPDGVVMHGYASTDPDARLTDAVEFVHVYGTACRVSDCLEAKQIDSETVETADGLVLSKELVEAAKQALLDEWEDAISRPAAFPSDTII